VTQSGAGVVSGASNVNAGSGAVALDNAGNDFATLGVTGGAISIVDTNALALSALVSAPNQAVSVVAGGDADPAGDGDRHRQRRADADERRHADTVGTLRGTNVALTSTGAMTLGQRRHLARHARPDDDERADLQNRLRSSPPARRR
jgi:hypothetical protein